MTTTPNHWELGKAAAKRAVEQEAVENLKFALVKQTGQKDFAVQYGFFCEPSEEDLEVLSLMETEMYAASWQWVGEITYEWSVSEKDPSLAGDVNSAVIYTSTDVPDT